MTPDIRFHLSDFDLMRKRRVERLLGPLETFGLLTAKEAGKVQHVLDQIDQAEVAGSNVALRIQQAAGQIAERVLSGELDIDAIDAAVVNIPQPAAVVSIVTAVAGRLVGRAEHLAFIHVDKAVETLNREFEAISERAAELDAHLAEIPDAETALAAGKGEHWLELGRLHEHYETVAALVEELRDAGHLAQAERGTFGAWWRTRRPANVGKSRYYLQDRHSSLLFLDDALAGLYLPVSQEEAESVRKLHEAEVAAFGAELRGGA